MMDDSGVSKPSDLTLSTTIKPSRNQLTDSAWFWGGLFFLAAMVGVVVIENKYMSRQGVIEDKYRGRQESWHRSVLADAEKSGEADEIPGDLQQDLSITPSNTSLDSTISPQSKSSESQSKFSDKEASEFESPRSRDELRLRFLMGMCLLGFSICWIGQRISAYRARQKTFLTDGEKSLAS